MGTAFQFIVTTATTSIAIKMILIACNILRLYCEHE
jgi:hypothetical protein